MSNIKTRIRTSYIGNLLSGIKRWYKQITFNYRKELGYVHPTASVENPVVFKNPRNVYLYEHTILRRCIVMTPEAKFIMKKYSGSAEGLTVITGNHDRFVGRFYRTIKQSEKTSRDKDVIIEEDCWLGVHVTLLPGVVIGRGATIGAGCVVSKSIPPYAIVIGNPAKIVGFNYSPEEIVEHEKHLYPEEERLPFELLQKNYEKYFLKRIKEITEYTRIY